MAEKGCRDGNPRRPSFRKTLTDAALPPDYLDSLEQKRRQLDESIHKYIAAKEREYKLYERDLKLQLRLVQNDGDREVSDRAQVAAPDPTGNPDRQPQLGTGEANAERRSHDSEVVLIEGVASRPIHPTQTDRRTSHERDQELVGLFTPEYLPALGGNTTSMLLRTSSEPPLVQSSEHNDLQVQFETKRSNSDTAVPTKSKRPSQLQLTHRTSSSGSSADGKLTSALKSPTQSAKPKRKRVSLAVGDVIVAPSDSVPLTASNNSTPSHSRTRSPVSVMETVSAQKSKATSLPIISSAETRRTENNEAKETRPQSPDAENAEPPQAYYPPSTQSHGHDTEGDLFHLEDDEMDAYDQDSPFQNPFGSEDDVVGRIDRGPKTSVPLSQSPEDEYVDDGGLVPEFDEDQDHIEFGPGSATASQQPTSPGFRRPSVSMDPVYRGNDWTRAEYEAVVSEVYGSRYTEPGSKGSFTAGSLGESYMARNAEKLMRSRAGRDQAQVRP